MRYDLQIFFPFSSCLILLMVSFFVQNLFSLSIYFCFFLLLVSDSNNHLQDQYQGAYHLFSFRKFMISVHTFVCNPFELTLVCSIR